MTGVRVVAEGETTTTENAKETQDALAAHWAPVFSASPADPRCVERLLSCAPKWNLR